MDKKTHFFLPGTEPALQVAAKSLANAE